VVVHVQCASSRRKAGEAVEADDRPWLAPGAR
jgi:hypothetical protein